MSLTKRQYNGLDEQLKRYFARHLAIPKMDINFQFCLYYSETKHTAFSFTKHLCFKFTSLYAVMNHFILL